MRSLSCLLFQHIYIYIYIYASSIKRNAITTIYRINIFKTIIVLIVTCYLIMMLNVRSGICTRVKTQIPRFAINYLCAPFIEVIPKPTFPKCNHNVKMTFWFWILFSWYLYYSQSFSIVVYLKTSRLIFSILYFLWTILFHILGLHRHMHRCNIPLNLFERTAQMFFY